MHRKTMAWITLLAILIVGGWSVVALTGAALGNAGPPPPLTHYGKPNLYPAGVPAITPSMNTSVALTKTDVLQYVKANGYSGGPVVSGSHLVVEKVLFITSEQASALLNDESIGRANDTIVCFVQLRGPFLIEGIDVPYGVSNPNPTIQRGYEIFDTHTGNLLGWGGLN